jgi:hypothetical protein
VQQPDCTADTTEMRARSVAKASRKTRLDGRTGASKQARALAQAFMVALGHPTGRTTHAAVLAASELLVAAENARAALLAGRGDVDQVVRIENLAARAVRRLGLKPGDAKSAYDLDAFQRAIEAGRPARETAAAATARSPQGDPP